MTPAEVLAALDVAEKAHDWDAAAKAWKALDVGSLRSLVADDAVLTLLIRAVVDAEFYARDRAYERARSS